MCKKEKTVMKQKLMKKKTLIILIVILVLLCGWGIRSVYNNCRFGRELYSAVNQMSSPSYLLAKAIDHLENEFEKMENEYQGDDRHAFDTAMFEIRRQFDGDGMPLLEDVCAEWRDQFEELYQQTKSNEGLAYIFTDKGKFDEVANLRDQLYDMTYAFIEFGERYNRMSEWERYFVSWKDEQKILSEKVRFSPLPQ